VSGISKPSLADWFAPGEQLSLPVRQLSFADVKPKPATSRVTLPSSGQTRADWERHERKQEAAAAKTMKVREARRAAREANAIKRGAKERARKLYAELGTMGDALHPLGDLLDKWAPLRAKYGVPVNSFDAIKRHVANDLKTVGLTHATHNPQSEFHTEVYGSVMALKKRALKLRRIDWSGREHPEGAIEYVQAEVAAMRRIIDAGRERLAGIIRTGHHSWL